MAQKLKVGVAGLGTVGAAVVRLMQERPLPGLELSAVSARNPGLDRGLDLSHLFWKDDPRALAIDCDVVVELIGGAEETARQVVTCALEHGKPVVTANKALLATHGFALARMAEAAGVGLYFEAAVAGGVPIIKLLRESLAVNHIHRIYGILNGTCNYVLTVMRDEGISFNQALQKAQAAGYAEADSSLDLAGHDTAHKLALLTWLAFGVPPHLSSIDVKGVMGIDPVDIRTADDFGLRIKLLGITECFDSEQGKYLKQRISPCLLPKNSALADIEGVVNAVVVESDLAGLIMIKGQGAGANPTASAVLADLIDLARGHPPLALSSDRSWTSMPIGQHKASYYLRLMVQDKAGVLAEISTILGNQGVSIESVSQRGPAQSSSGLVPIVLITHEAEEACFQRVLASITSLSSVTEPPMALLRIPSQSLIG